jgi:hypothetical protein
VYLQENAHDAINTSLQKVAQQSKIKRQVCKIFFCEMLMYMLIDANKEEKKNQIKHPSHVQVKLAQWF